MDAQGWPPCDKMEVVGWVWIGMRTVFLMPHGTFDNIFHKKKSSNVDVLQPN